MISRVERCGIKASYIVFSNHIKPLKTNIFEVQFLIDLIDVGRIESMDGSQVFNANRKYAGLLHSESAIE